ncbi:MAG TPA: hypothetical protein VJ865_08020 [Gemmatimonadaceae bacterium]|nr:hypothetical protein [Gemmatimonadaceae bacterium]
MATNALNIRRVQGARQQSLFREVNERIDELAERLLIDDSEPLYVCECMDTDCCEMIKMPSHEYRQIRLNGNLFIIAPGHEQLDVDEIVDQDRRWLIVRKRGVGAEVAQQLANHVA